MSALSKTVQIGRVRIGAGCPVAIQTMATTDTRDVDATVTQLRELSTAGADIIRIAVVDDAAADSLPMIRREVPDVPLVADIHFHAHLALRAIAAGVDKIRINPGNIGSVEKVREVVAAAKKAGVPIRVGVNAGSFEKAHAAGVKASNEEIADHLVGSALENVRLLETMDFGDIVVSAKASATVPTVLAYRKLSTLVQYPLHLGVTESGAKERGIIRSSAAFGGLLIDGIGSTLRYSLADDPVEEVKAGKMLLKALGMRNEGVDIVACPTCGRLEVPMLDMVAAAEKALAHIRAPVMVAIMGCFVNGPGEAKQADYALIGGRGVYMLMKKAEKVAVVSPEEALPRLIALLKEDGIY